MLETPKANKTQTVIQKNKLKWFENLLDWAISRKDS